MIEEARLIAKQQGQARYLSAIMCVHGHLGERYTKGGACCECLTEKARQATADRRAKRSASRQKDPRQIARTNGESRYTTGQPCKNGHLSERLVHDGKCIQCVTERRQNWMRKPETRAAQKQRTARWREENRDYTLDEKRKWYSENKDRHHAKVREWAAANREKVLQYRRTSYANNLEHNRAYGRASAHKVRMATPPWANKEELKLIYRLCPKGYEVDHKVPIKGKIICGLHVIENVQYLPASKNSAKNNKWPYPESFDSYAIAPFSWEHFHVIGEQS
jgi:hypothetical protein